nr:hypothetical protein [uncultured Chitinophaga sp.]
MKPFIFLLLSITCGTPAFAQTPGQPATRKTSRDDRPPVYFVDSVQVTAADLAEFNPNNVAYVCVLKSKDLHSGQDIKTIFIETKTFVRHRYWLIFSQDAAYRKLVPSPEEDGSVAYIVNGKLQTATAESDLAAVNIHSFISLAILDKAALEQQYGVKGKKHGVVVQLKKDN